MTGESCLSAVEVPAKLFSFAVSFLQHPLHTYPHPHPPLHPLPRPLPLPGSQAGLAQEVSEEYLKKSSSQLGVDATNKEKKAL